MNVDLLFVASIHQLFGSGVTIWDPASQLIDQTKKKLILVGTIKYERFIPSDFQFEYFNNLLSNFQLWRSMFIQYVFFFHSIELIYMRKFMFLTFVTFWDMYIKFIVLCKVHTSTNNLASLLIFVFSLQYRGGSPVLVVRLFSAYQSSDMSCVDIFSWTDQPSLCWNRNKCINNRKSSIYLSFTN